MKPTLWACLLALAVLPPIHALASHYRLPIDALIGPEETAALRAEGVETTLALLARVSTVRGRAQLAAATSLTRERVDVLATQVDLLRVEGVGPSMVRVLQAAGVRHTGELAATDASALLARMEAANAREQIAPVLPREPSLHHWILQARRMPRLLEGI